VAVSHASVHFHVIFCIMVPAVSSGCVFYIYMFRCVVVVCLFCKLSCYFDLSL